MRTARRISRSVRAPLADPARSQWVDVVPHQRGRMIISMRLFKDYLVWLEREAGLPRIVCRDFASGEEHAVAFEEEAYHLRFEENLGYRRAISCALPIRR